MQTLLETNKIQLEESLNMWKRLFIIFFLVSASHAYSNDSLTDDVAKTYQSLLTTPNFEARVLLVDAFVKRSSEIRQRLIRKRRRTNEDILVLFHINILQNFHSSLDTSSSRNCTRSLENVKTTLHPNRVQAIMLPFEQSIYNLYNKMCAL